MWVHVSIFGHLLRSVLGLFRPIHQSISVLSAHDVLHIDAQRVVLSGEANVAWS